MASKSPEEIYQAIKEIPGWFELEEIEALSKLKMPAIPMIVECGTYCGRSATAFSNLWPSAIITTCDPVDEPKKLPQNVFYRHCTGKKLSEIWHPSVIDLLFIDDRHDYDTVKENFDAFEPLIKKNGYVIFHDYCFETNDVEGVRRFVNELGNCDIVPGKYGLAIWRKP